MCDSLPADEARFVVFDFADVRPDGRQIKKLVLVKWCPDAVSFRIKPVVGASYQTLKEKCVERVAGGGVRFLPISSVTPPPIRPSSRLTGLGKDIQASDKSDMAYDAIKNQL